MQSPDFVLPQLHKTNGQFTFQSKLSIHYSIFKCLWRRYAIFNIVNHMLLNMFFTYKSDSSADSDSGLDLHFVDRPGHYAACVGRR